MRSCQPPIQRRNRHTGLFDIVERINRITNRLSRFVPFAGDQQYITRPKGINAAQDRFGPVGHFCRLGDRSQNGPADQFGVFGARIVIGDKGHIRISLYRLAHQWTFAGIAVPARTKHNDQSAKHMRSQRTTCRGKRVWCVRVIHEDARPIGTRSGMFHSATDRLKLREDPRDVF